MKNLTPAQRCVEYILDTEAEDFDENPSENHIFYTAMIAKWGKEYADRELADVIHYNDTGEGKI